MSSSNHPNLRMQNLGVFFPSPFSYLRYFRILLIHSLNPLGSPPMDHLKPCWVCVGQLAEGMKAGLQSWMKEGGIRVCACVCRMRVCRDLMLENGKQFLYLVARFITDWKKN